MKADQVTDRAPGVPVGLPLLRCADLARTFGTGATAVVAVHDVSCVIPPGARIAVTGPSGSGKSTLLHLFAGLDSPTRGTLEWPGLGGRPHGRPGSVGMVFQGPSLIPALDVTQNVALPLLFDGVRDEAATERAVEALKRTRIAELGRKLPDELSGGQAQRVAVARVLASRPRLILADEPTGQLDHETGERVISVLLEAARDLGAALVVSTHDPRIASRFSQRWAMHDGEVRVPAGAEGHAADTDASTDARADQNTDPSTVGSRDGVDAPRPGAGRDRREGADG